MPRRASSSAHPLWIIAAIALLLLAVVGGYFVYSYVGDPYRTLTPLDLPAYLENSNSLRGNTYKVDGTVDNQLAWSTGVGRLYSVRVTSSNGVQPVPLLIPAIFNSVNVQKGQRFLFKIEVGEKGILRVIDIRKV